MNPISFSRPGPIGAAITAFTAVLRNRRKTRKPNEKTAGPDVQCHQSPNLSILHTSEAGMHNTLPENLRFLVVDDNEINRQIAARSHQSAGATVTVAGDGEQAVRLLERERFDLIVMDIEMPVMDGYAATRYLRTQLGLNVPILAMTAGATSDGRARCLHAGMNDYMIKPFEPSELFQRITRLLIAVRPRSD